MPSATHELRRRFLTLDPTDADTDTFELSFSSETPVARQYGDEVLSHAAGAADLSRLNDSAPLLFNHNPDQLLGVVDGARVVGGNLIETQLLADSFIEALRDRLAVADLGATFISGLVGNVDIPKRTGSATAY